MTATPDDWEEMTESGHLRDASEMNPEEADEWAALRGVKIVRT